MKFMNIRKYSYVRALFYGIPMGLAFLCGGIKVFIEIPRTTSELVLEKGKISSFGKKAIYDKSSETNYNTYYVKLEGREYYAVLGKHKLLLEKELPFLLSKSSEVKVWHEEGKFYIKQIVVGDTMLIKYKPPYWIGHVFFWFGLVALVSAVGYVILHPEDYTREKKENPSK